MYNCMANCEEDASLVKMEEVRNCLNKCADLHMTDRRNIVENEVKRLTGLIHKELDACTDRANETTSHPNYTQGLFTKCGQDVIYRPISDEKNKK